MSAIDELAKTAIQAASREIEEAKKESQTLDQYVALMVKDKPNDVIDKGEFSEMAVIPGFKELTFGIAAVYGLKWGALEFFFDSKTKAFEPHLVPTQIGIHVVRGFSRKEWGDLQLKVIEDTKNRLTHHEEQNTEQRWREVDIQMRTEEMMVCAGCVEPKYNRETVRVIPAGTVSYLAQSIMHASGFDNQPLPPLPLK